MIAQIAYAARGGARPRYHANDQSRDVLTIELQAMPLTNARTADATLDTQGFALVPHNSTVTNWYDPDSVATIHAPEIIDLIKAQSGADEVYVTSPGLLRFSEASAQSGAHNNSRPARFAHVDISARTANDFAERGQPEGSTHARFAHFNIWRALSVPPQDVPLAVCDARSVMPHDLITADAVFDEPGMPEWSFEGLVVAHNAAHRWHWFPDMHAGEALIFKTYDSDPTRACCVPHVAFDNQACPPGTPPRVSLEMRATAYWA